MPKRTGNEVTFECTGCPKDFYLDELIEVDEDLFCEPCVRKMNDHEAYLHG